MYRMHTTAICVWMVAQVPLPTSNSYINPLLQAYSLLIQSMILQVEKAISKTSQAKVASGISYKWQLAI